MKKPTYIPNYKPFIIIYMEKRFECFLLFFILITIIYPSTSSSPLYSPNPFITFLINDMLAQTTPSFVPKGDNIGGGLPFSRPTGLFGPRNDMPTATTSNGEPTSWLSFLTSVQGLELVNATEIEEQMTGSRARGLPLKGKVEGTYLTSSVDGAGAMVAMKAVIGDDGKSEDSLRFFGEYEPDSSESHIAVVGGSGKYVGANGFAVVRAIGDERDGSEMRMKQRLLFTVYIK